MEEAVVVTTVRLTEAMVAAIEKLAKEDDRTFSSAVRQLLLKALKEKKA